MSVGQIYAAHLVVIALPDQHDLFRARNEKDRLDRQQQEARDADGPAVYRRTQIAFARKNQFVALTQFLLNPGLKNRIAEIRDLQCRLPAGGAILFIADMRMGGVLAHRASAGYRLKKFRRYRDPADRIVGCKTGCGVRRRVRQRSPGAEQGHNHCARTKPHSQSAWLLTLTGDAHSTITPKSVTSFATNLGLGWKHGIAQETWLDPVGRGPLRLTR